MSDITGNKQAIVRYFDACNRGDGAAIAAMYAPGGIHIVTGNTPISGTYAGQQMAEVAGGLMRAFPAGLEFELGEMVADILQRPRELLQWGKRKYRSDEPMWLVGDNRRFVSATSWQPILGLEDGIRCVVSKRRQTRERQHAI